MPSFVNTFVLKLESVAISNRYVSGRTPLVLALFTVSVIGCLSTAIRMPLVGVMTAGVLMLTPGIGPATVADNGFELFELSHADAATAAITSTSGHRTLAFMAARHCVSVQTGRRIRPGWGLDQTRRATTSAGGSCMVPYAPLP